MKRGTVCQTVKFIFQFSIAETIHANLKIFSQPFCEREIREGEKISKNKRKYETVLNVNGKNHV